MESSQNPGFHSTDEQGSILKCSALCPPENFNSETISCNSYRNLNSSSSVNHNYLYSSENYLTPPHSQDKRDCYANFKSNSQDFFGIESHLTSQNFAVDIQKYGLDQFPDKLLSLRPLHSDSSSFSDNAVNINVTLNNKINSSLHIKNFCNKRTYQHNLVTGNYKPNEDKWECSKCGEGSPCSPFICKNKSINENNVQDSENSNKTDSNRAKGSVFDCHQFQKLSSEDNLEYENTFSSFFYQKKSRIFSSYPCSEDQRKDIYIDKKFSPKVKMQCDDNMKEFNSNIKLPKSVKNLSLTHDEKNINAKPNLQTCTEDSTSLLPLACNKTLSVKTTLSSSSVPSVEPELAKMHLDSLSEGTRNFLNELAASNSSNLFNESISGYALSSINSPIRSLKNKKISDSNLNNNLKQLSNEDKSKMESKDTSCAASDSVSKQEHHYLSPQNEDVLDVNMQDKDVAHVLCSINNEEKDVMVLQSLNEDIIEMNNIVSDVTTDKEETNLVCNNDTLEKDVTSALINIKGNEELKNVVDTGEQSHLDNQDLPSMEICTNLNQVISESTSPLSENITPVAECTDDTVVSMETNSITLCMDNESEIYLQAAESGISFTADETGTINLSDLSSGNNAEFWQRVVLVQDEEGNIETVYLLQDDKVDDLCAEISNIENRSLEGNLNTSETNQFMIIDNSMGDNLSNEEINVLVSQEATNDPENVLVVQDTVSDVSLKNTDVDMLDLQNDMDANKDSSNVDIVAESNNLLAVDNEKNCETPLEENICSNEKSHLMLDLQNDVDANKDSSNVDIVSESNNLLVVDNEQNCKAPPEENICSNEKSHLMLDLQNDADANKDSSNVDIVAESNNLLVVDNEKNCKASLEENICSNEKSHLNLSENDLLNNSNAFLKESPSNLINTHQTLPEFAEQSPENNVQNQNKDSTNLTNRIYELMTFKSNDSDELDINSPSKARKTFSSSLLNKTVSAEDSVLLNKITDTFSTDKIAEKHMNGDIYPSEASQTLLSKVECTDEAKSLYYKSVQKSRKSFPQNILSRSAKKSVFASDTSNFQLDSKSLKILQTHDESSPEYIKIRSLILKRTVEKEMFQNNKRAKTSSFDINENTNGILKIKNKTVALKTFKKPFTAAKKSVIDTRETLKNTAMKTFVPKVRQVQRALKTFPQKLSAAEINQAVSAENMQSYKFQTELDERSLFRPDICEYRNKSNESASAPEDNVSEEDIKLPSGYSSPIKEFLPHKFYCSCASKEMLCLCNEGNLQSSCEAEDSIDGKVVSCSNAVSHQYLMTPSYEIRHRAFCDIHLWRLREHHCCPKCGIFCSHGEFLHCFYEDIEKNENHLFHTTCSIVIAPGLPPSCPHCCRFSSFNHVELIVKDHLQDKEVPSNAQNITSELNGCDIYLISKEETVQQAKDDSGGFVPDKKELQVMITSLANQKSLRLRPTGKCLYNPIKVGDTQKVMQLIANGVNPNHKFRSHSNNSPIHVAVYNGWTGILHILLQAGAFIDSVNDDLETPLIVAVERNNLSLVRYLILAGAQIDVKDCNGMTSFHIASKNGFKEIAQFLYSTGTVDINLQDDGGWTALVWACEHKHVEFVKWLLDIGADPNVRDNEENTVLHWAAYSGKSEIAELLLDRGCTLSYVNKRGDSALHIAAREDNYECVKLFINHGAVVDQKNKENKTPLMCCQDDSLSFNYLCQSISSGALKIGKMQLEKHVVFRDISRGAEAYPIQAVNEVDDEEFIMEFRYVVKNCHRSGANINIVTTVDSMQFCYCKDNCVTRDCYCITNSKCWYDANGCLTSEYNLQIAPVIFECNKTCHCPKTCINRVVQQGLRYPLQLFRTKYKGWGVRTLQVIPKGAFVCEYVGELITGSEATQRDDDTYFFDLESKESDYCLDGRYYGNVARFLNHSCDPNLMAVKVFIDHQDLNFPRIAFFAIKRIQAFEELCFDYGLDFWIVKCQSILCTCNTQSCKYSKDTIDDTLTKFFKDTRYGEQLESGS